MSVIAMRGAPGSGKSTWIEDNLHGKENPCIISIYNYMRYNGQEKFRSDMIRDASNNCLAAFIDEITYSKNDQACIIIDSTNVQLCDVAPYAAVSQALKHDLTIVTMKCTEQIAIDRNIHEVPERFIRRMVQSINSISLPSRWHNLVVDNYGVKV